MKRRVVACLLTGLLAGVAVLATSSAPVRLEPDTAPWQRIVRGATIDGLIPEGAVLVLPGLDRSAPLEVRVVAEAAGKPASLGLSVDRGPLQWGYGFGGMPILFTVPAAASPGLRLDLRPAPGEQPRVRSLAVRGTARLPFGWALLAALSTAGLTAILFGRVAPTAALAIGLTSGGALGLAACPALLYLTLPASLPRLLVPLVLLVVAAAVVMRSDSTSRRQAWQGGLLLAACVFGGWVRLYFLPSTGSWDTEYWKAWMLRAASDGVTGVYGDPGAVPAGHFLSQLRGAEPLWKIEWHGRAYVVDYPPLAMALWRASWGLVGRAAMDYAEALSVAVKLPAVVGDVGAVGLLLLVLRDRPQRARALAALYWVLPVSWLSSATLGYLDGAFAPLLVAALLAAATNRPGWAGALLAAACLIKPTAIVVAPAAATALAVGGGGIRRALAGGLVVVAAALLPFALAGTLATAVVHCYRILFQGTLSGGYPNPWWLLGHLLQVAHGAPLDGPVQYARLDLLPFSPRPLGTALFALAALFVVQRQRFALGPASAQLSGTALFFAYGMLAVGVHENHPHPLFLLLLATGIASTRLRVIFGAAAAVYVLDMLSLSGIGRFHGPRFSALEPVVQLVASLRMSLGFDLTLLLVPVNLAAFAWLLAALRAENASLPTQV